MDDKTKTETLSYSTQIKSLFAILDCCNLANSDNKQGWQKPGDAYDGGAFGKVRDALIELAGVSIYEHWLDTGEIDMQLANR